MGFVNASMEGMAVFSIKQGEGNRENVSAMVTICADGTYTTLTAIFKGKNYNLAWAKADNTLNMQ